MSIKSQSQPSKRYTGASVNLTINGKPVQPLSGNGFNFNGLTNGAVASTSIPTGGSLTPQIVDESTLLMKIGGMRDFTLARNYFDLTEEEITVVVRAGWQPAGVTFDGIISDLRASGKWQHDKLSPPPTEPLAPVKQPPRKHGPRWKTES